MAQKVDDWDFGYAQLEEICKYPLGDVQPAKKLLDLKIGKESWENPLNKDSAGTAEAWYDQKDGRKETMALTFSLCSNREQKYSV